MSRKYRWRFLVPTERPGTFYAYFARLEEAQRRAWVNGVDPEEVEWVP